MKSTEEYNPWARVTDPFHGMPVGPVQLRLFRCNKQKPKEFLTLHSICMMYVIKVVVSMTCCRGPLAQDNKRRRLSYDL